MNRSLFFLCIVLALISCSDPEPTTVRFEVSCPPIPEDQAIYIAGNTDALGMWDPGAVAMKRESKALWSFEMPVDSAMEIEYKFTMGSWATEALNDDGSVFQNFTATVVSGDTLRHAFNKFKTGEDTPANLESTVVGDLQIFENIESDGLQPRDLLVWTPPSYAEGQKRYPVLYMHDGQNVFDVATSGFQMEWKVDESCTQLMAEGRIPEMIIVATTSTIERSKDYGPWGDGTKYMEFIVNELKPRIDSDFRTKPEREFTFCGGASLGGLISFRMAWEYSHVFSRALCMSPAFQFDSFDYVEQISDDTSPMVDTRFYLDNGGVGLESELQPGIDNMLEMLKARGMDHGEDYVWLLDPEAEHNENAWAKRFPDAIQMLLHQKQ